MSREFLIQWVWGGGAWELGFSWVSREAEAAGPRVRSEFICLNQPTSGGRAVTHEETEAVERRGPGHAAPGAGHQPLLAPRVSVSAEALGRPQAEG